MVIVTIGNESKELRDVTERWINQSINPLKAKGLHVCVEVVIQANGLNMRLATPGCGNGTGGGRPPSRKEKEVFGLWERRGLNDPRFTGGSLTAFLNQLGPC